MTLTLKSATGSAKAETGTGAVGVIVGVFCVDGAVEVDGVVVVGVGVVDLLVVGFSAMKK